MSETIQLYTNKVTTEPEDKNCTLVTINNIEADEIVAQFTASELLRAIADHYDLSTIIDWVKCALEDKSND